MVYTPPNRVTFRQMVSRDLRDANNSVFGPAEVDDLVNFGIVEVSRLYPVEAIEVVDVTTDVASGKVNYIYPTSCSEVWRVEVWRDGVLREQVPLGDENSASGWDAYAGRVSLPPFVTLDPDALDSVRVYGYQQRETLHADDDVAEVDPEAEMGVRLYATLRGYQKLQNDRAQFQQWLAIPGNNDISATQLDGMTNTYEAQWNRHRNHIRTLRR